MSRSRRADPDPLFSAGEDGDSNVLQQRVAELEGVINEVRHVEQAAFRLHRG